MTDDASGSPLRADRGSGQESGVPGARSDVTSIGIIESNFDDDFGDDGDGGVDTGFGSGGDAGSGAGESFPVGFGDAFGKDHEPPAGDAEERERSFPAVAVDNGGLDADSSPWAPLTGMLDSTERQDLPDDGPFAPSEGVERAHALELRAESMLQYAARGALRTGELDRTEVGVSDDNRDVVAGRDEVAVDGMLDEHTGHGLVVIADEVEMNVEGPLRMQAHLEDNIIMAGVMRDEWAGGTLITAAMSDDMAAGLGLRCTAPLDVWAHGLVGMEERPGTCAADGMLFELAGTLYEREYGPSAHMAAVARFQTTVATTMKTGFFPLMKTALGVRNLIPGGGGGGGSADASPPAAPPVGGGGDAAGAATLGAVESGGALGRGVADGDDTDEIVSVVRSAENASDASDVEDLQHPASTADNLDDLARVEVEGEGYRQVAEIYEQPLPASASGSDADQAEAAATPAATRSRREPPEIYTIEPGAEGYDFGEAYKSLGKQNEFFRQDSNWRGNIFMREYLLEIDEKAVQLLAGVTGSSDGVAGNNYGYKAANIYDELARLADQAQEAGDLEQVARIQDAMGELEQIVSNTTAQVVMRSDEFSGAALGAQRVPIDPNIDTEKLKHWITEQLSLAQAKFDIAETLDDPVAKQKAVQYASWESAYWVQLQTALAQGINPLSDSSEQLALLYVEKIEPFNLQYTTQTTADIAALGMNPGDWAIVPPRAPAQDQLDLFLEFHDRLIGALSDPEFFRGAEEMGGDVYAGGIPPAPGSGPDLPGPDSLRPLGEGVDEPDLHPVIGAEAPTPPPPDAPALDPSPGAGSSTQEAARPPPEPSTLNLTEPGAEGYDFRKSYRSLEDRKYFYRAEFNYRGNLFVREYLQGIDAEALKLFAELDGPADAIDIDNAGHRVSSVYSALETMAAEADAAGDASRAAEIRAAMAKIEDLVHSTIVEVAARTDEFSGAALGSQRAAIDPNIDTEKLQSWLTDQMQIAQARRESAVTDEADRLAAWEWGYYLRMSQSLEEGVNPLAVSNEQITFLQISEVQPYYENYRLEHADEIAAAEAAGYEFVIPRPKVENEVAVYVELQELLLAKLSDPEYFRSAEAVGAGAYPPSVFSRIEAGLDVLGPDSLHPIAGSDNPPPLPAADFADGAGYVDEVRDRSFARSALAANEEALQRQAAGLSEGDASIQGHAATAGFEGPGTADSAFGGRRPPPDNAQLPNIDDRSGGWLVEPPSPSGIAPEASDGSPALAWRDSASPQGLDVSWESGLLVSGDPEVVPAAGGATDADSSDLFKAASEPVDPSPESFDDAHHTPALTDDPSTGSPHSGPDGTGSEDANPTGAVSEPDDIAPPPGRDGGTDPGAPGVTSSLTPEVPDPAPTGTSHNAPGTDGTPAGASNADADPEPAGMRSDLYQEPVSFEGRSLEGTSGSDDPAELAQSLDAAEMPIDDLPRAEPDPVGPERQSILKNSDGRPVTDTYRDANDMLIKARREQAEFNKRYFNRGGETADSVWSSGHNRKAAIREANARWSEAAAAQRTSALSFGDDPRQLLYHVEYERTVSRKGSDVDLFRAVDPPNTIDRSHAAHFIPRPRGWETTRETGFGRLSQGMNEFPFSPREQIVNALSKGEALSPLQIADLESGLEGYHAAVGELSSAQYQAMQRMISDLGDQYLHFRWHTHGTPDSRLVQLIEMLDYAAAV